MAARDPAGELAALRALALRLLAAPWQPGVPQAVSPQAALLVGQVAARLAAGAAAARRRAAAGQPRAEPALVRRRAGQLARAGRGAGVLPPQELGARGWREPEAAAPRLGGFVAAGLPDQSSVLRAVFVRSEQGPTRTVQALPVANARTDVRLDLQTDPQAVPRPQSDWQRWRPVLPTLLPPAGAQQWPRGGSTSPTLARSSTVVETAAELAALAAHYRGQLECAGGTLGGAARQGAAAWSTWTFHDEQQARWNGVLYLLQWLDPPRRFLAHLCAERAGRAPLSVGGMGYSALTATRP
jgi:hypothetical protein